MSKKNKKSLEPKEGEVTFAEGPPAGHHYLRQVYHVNDIIDHRWNQESKEYEFEVTWQRCKANDTTWETANSFNMSSSARRCLIQYMNAKLPEDDAQKIRILSAGSRKRKILTNEAKGSLPQDSMPEV